MVYGHTDVHNVDENMMTIPSCSGYSDWGTSVGIFLRQPDNPTDIRLDVVTFTKK